MDNVNGMVISNATKKLVNKPLQTYQLRLKISDIKTYKYKRKDLERGLCLDSDLYQLWMAGPFGIIVMKFSEIHTIVLKTKTH